MWILLIVLNVFRLEYVCMDELVVLCLSTNQPSKKTPADRRIVAVMSVHMQLHSFLPASSVAHISDITIDEEKSSSQRGKGGGKGMFFGIALDIEKEGIYAGKFKRNN